jgi:hypothetical protein
MHGLTEIERMNLEKALAAKKARLTPWKKLSILAGYTAHTLVQIIRGK